MTARTVRRAVERPPCQQPEAGTTAPERRDGGTRQKILDCAAHLFSQHGYAEGSIRNIAGAIGIRGPSVYHHFPSKEEMTTALLREAADRACQEIEQVDVEALRHSPAALFEAAMEAHLKAYLAPDQYLSALVRIYRQLPPELLNVARAALKPYLDWWIEIIGIVAKNRKLSDTDGEAMALLLFGALNSLIEWQLRPQTKPVSEVLDLFNSVIVAGLTADPAKG